MDRQTAELIVQTLTGGNVPLKDQAPIFGEHGWKFSAPWFEGPERSNKSFTKDGKYYVPPRVVSPLMPEFYVPSNMHQSINNALDALTTDDLVGDKFFSWGELVLPPGEITLTGSGLELGSRGNICIRGTGMPGDEGISGSGDGAGMTQLIVPATAGAVGIKGGDGSNMIFTGPKIQDIGIVGNATAAGGILMHGYSNGYISRVTSNGFSTGYDLMLKGTAGSGAERFFVERFIGSGSKYGLRGDSMGSGTFVGCEWFGNQNGNIGIIAGGKGVYCDGSLSGGNTFLGCKIQGFETLVELTNNQYETFIGGFYEWFTTYGVRLNPTGAVVGVSFIGGTVNNTINGGGGTAFKLESGVLNFLAITGGISGVATRITNSSGNNSHLVLFNDEIICAALRNYGRTYSDTYGFNQVVNSAVGGAQLKKIPAYYFDGTFAGYLPLYES